MRYRSAALFCLVCLLSASPARAVTIIDDFETGSLSNWIAPCGGWGVASPGRNSNFALELTGTSCCGAPADHMLTHSSFMGSYGRYSFDLFFTSAGIANGDLLLQVNGSSAIQCQFGPSPGDNAADFVSLVNGNAGTALACTPIHLVAGTWHAIAIERYANGVIQVLTDGVLRMAGLETSLAATGRIALAGHSTGVRFDNIAFDPSLPPAPAPPAPGSCPSFGPYAGCQLPAPPPQPTGVSATSGERCRVLVSWQDGSGESGYRVYRNNELAGTVAADIVQFSDAVAAGTYTYCVASFNSSSESPSSCAQGSSSAPPTFYAENGNYYERVEAPLHWTAAKLAAEGYSFLSSTGHLVTTTSSGEVAFVSQLAGADHWLGGYQADTSDEPAGGWAWVTGEPFAFTSWASGEPNNGLIGDERENYLEMKDSGGGWNDVVQGDPNQGFVVEYDTAMPLAAPLSVTASDDAYDHVAITWSASAGAARYHVYRGGVLIADLSSTTTEYTDAPAVGTYPYCVRSVNQCGSESGLACDQGSRLAAGSGGGGDAPCFRRGRPCPMVTLGGGRATGRVLRAVHGSSLSQAADLEVDLEQGATVRLDLYDLLGRRVRTLFEGHLPTGLSRFRWDGRDGNGAVARRGVYLARLLMRGGRHSTAVVLGP